MASGAFGLRLKELRAAAGLTQGALAEASGLSKGFVCDLEQGRKEAPNWVAVLALCAALEATPNDFLEAASGPIADLPRGRPAKAPPESAKRGRGRPRKK